MHANNQLPPLMCRICRPPVGFWKYTVFRAHIRAAHHIKQINNVNLRQFETYPGSSSRVVRDMPSGSQPPAPQPPNVAVPPPNAVPNVPQAHGQNAQPPAVQNGQLNALGDAAVQNDVEANKSQNVPPNNNAQQTAGIGATADGAAQNDVASQNFGLDDGTAGQANVSDIVAVNRSAAGATGALYMDPNEPVFSVEQVQSLIRFEMDRVLKKRLPSLGTELQLRVDAAVGRAMSNEVPNMVGELLFEAAQRYASDGVENASLSSNENRTVERSGSRMTVSFTNPNMPETGASQTESDEELLAISPSMVDGPAPSTSLVAVVSVVQTGANTAQQTVSTEPSLEIACVQAMAALDSKNVSDGNGSVEQKVADDSDDHLLGSRVAVMNELLSQVQPDAFVDLTNNSSESVAE